MGDSDAASCKISRISVFIEASINLKSIILNNYDANNFKTISALQKVHRLNKIIGTKMSIRLFKTQQKVADQKGLFDLIIGLSKIYIS